MPRQIAQDRPGLHSILTVFLEKKDCLLDFVFLKGLRDTWANWIRCIYFFAPKNRENRR